MCGKVSYDGPFGSRKALAYGDRVGVREIMWG